MASKQSVRARNRVRVLGTTLAGAFTLLEMLVVVATISFLLAILLPSLAVARRESQRTLCLTNLRTLAAGSAVYCTQDAAQNILPVHPTADQNTRHDDGFFDFGGSNASESFWIDNVVIGATQRTAGSRPLNQLLATGGSNDWRAFHCPNDEGFNPPYDYPEWPVWSPVLREMSAFDAVGTSYWGNACRALVRDPQGGARSVVKSYGVFLRPADRVPSTGDTVLYMEMPTLFNLAVFPGEPSVLFHTLGVNGWHGASPVFNLAYCDGHAQSLRIAVSWRLGLAANAGPMAGADRMIRLEGVRFDCYPDPPILDPPSGISEKGLAEQGAQR